MGSIMLDRPAKLNALATAVLEEMLVAIHWLDAQEDITVVVFGGHGRAFSAGADLEIFDAVADVPTPRLRHMADLGRQVADALESMRAVTVARLHGQCVGGALVLALACDLRVAAASTIFAVPELALGVPLGWGGVPRLVREIGLASTRELVLTCGPWDTARARAAGLVTEVVDDKELDAAVERLSGELASKSPLSLQMTKRQLAAATATGGSSETAWSDADALLSALNDSRSREVAAHYLAQRRRD